MQIPPLEFWEEEAKLLLVVVFGFLWQFSRKGAREGESLLTRALAQKPGVSTELDWELVNDYARSWAMVHTSEVVAQITKTSMEAFVAAFPDWVASGKPLKELIKQLKPAYGVRARAIAVTETTRAYAEGNTLAWKTSGVVDGSQWMTSEDEMVCPICGELNGKIAPLGDEFPGGYKSPPAHVGCRCWLHPVVRA